MIGFLLLTTPAYADCIGCFDIIKVRAEFTNGSSREAYLVHYASSTPLQSDFDSSQIVPLDKYDTSHYYNGKVPLLRAIYQFEGITTATTQADIDSIEVSDLLRLVYLQNMKFGAWGQINVYSPRVIELLGKMPSARYDQEEFTHVYLAFDPRVTDGDLQTLVELRDWERSLGVRLQHHSRILCAQTSPVLSEDDFNCTLSGELNILYERLFSMDSLTRSGPVGDYLKTIRTRIVLRLDYLNAMRTRLSYSWRDYEQDAVSRIGKILGASGCDTSRTAHLVRNGRIDSLLCALAACSGLWMDIESDYEELLQKTDIVEISNEND